MGVCGQRHAPAALNLGDKPGTHCIGGWVGPRAGLDVYGNFRPPTGIRSPDRPARSKSFYRLSYTRVKVKWPGYGPGVAQRVGRVIALLVPYRGTRRGWVVSSTPRPYFTPGKDAVPILQETGWAPGPVWTGEIPRSRTVQPVVGRYTDWATGPTIYKGA